MRIEEFEVNWNSLADRLLPPFTESKAQRPREMLYVAADRPPWPTALSAALQHALIALMFVVYSLITAEAIGLEGAALRDFVAIGILVMGLGTALNGLTTRMSAGHLLVYVPDPLTMGVFIATAATFGPSAAAGGLIVMAVIMMLLGRFLPLLRPWFPAEISGIALILLGITLIAPGIERAAGLQLDMTDVTRIDPGAVLIATLTLATMVGLSVWSVGRARLLALIIGTAVGLLVAVLLGEFGLGELGQVAAEPLFAVPGADYTPVLPQWELGAIIAFLPVSLVVLVDTVGCGITIDKMTHANWRRPDLRMIGRLLNGLGICNILNGLSGTLGSSLSWPCLGLAHMSGVAARRIGVMAGLLLMLLAFLPQITLFIALIPKAVVGAILLYTASYMIISGAELIMSRLLDARRRATVGLSLVAGITVFGLPELTAQLPPDLRPLFGSSLLVGTLSAILLNRLFRIGATQTSEIILEGPDAVVMATRHIEEQGAYWGGRREVFERAQVAIEEALEILAGAGVMEGVPKLRARFDEYRLQLSLKYPGGVLPLTPAPQIDLLALMESNQDETALDQAMAAVSASLVRHLADRVEILAQDGQAELRLWFEH